MKQGTKIDNICFGEGGSVLKLLITYVGKFYRKRISV